MSSDMRDRALNYHKGSKPGKLEIRATKPMSTAADLALAYSPGVAHPCEAIVENPLAAADYTARNNFRPHQHRWDERREPWNVSNHNEEHEQNG